MVAEIEIGDSSDYTVYFGDGAAGAVDTYGVYVKPVGLKMILQTPASIAELFDLDNQIIKQLGKIIVLIKMKDIIIDTFAEFENFKKAMYNWAGTSEFGGKLLTLQCKDKNGNEWSKIPTYAASTTLSTIGVKIIKPVEIEPLPSGKYMIKYLEAIRVKTITDVDDE